MDRIRPELRAQGVEVVNSHRGDLRAVLQELGSRSLQSVLVEGGAAIAGEFIDAGLVNKVTFFIAPKIIGGTEAPSAVGGKGVELMADALELERDQRDPARQRYRSHWLSALTKGIPSDEG